LEDPLESPEAHGRRRLRSLVIGVLVVSVLAGSAYTVLETVFGVGLFHRPFDREAWAAEGSEEAPRKRSREAMVQNLVKWHLGLGMSRAEVEELLGAPDPDPTLAPREEGDWIYELGATFFERLHFTWWALTDTSDDDLGDFEEVSEILKIRALMIGFDGDGRVDRIEIVEV